MDMIENCKKRAELALYQFLRNFGHVPDDKLHWKPVPSAKSALQIAAHCAGYSGGFAGIIKAGKFPDSVEEFLGPINARIQSVTTREEAVAVLEQGIADTLEALDHVTPEQTASTIETPIGPTPFLFFMTIPSNHLVNHTGQIDYLQTCWDDQQVYFE
ncbi:MAG: DinB family protein [Armatimonadetes bacterium]|nr:DinB family protein [Armatimonadota bacterium]